MRTGGVTRTQLFAAIYRKNGKFSEATGQKETHKRRIREFPEDSGGSSTKLRYLH